VTQAELLLAVALNVVSYDTSLGWVWHRDEQKSLKFIRENKTRQDKEKKRRLKQEKKYNQLN